MKTALITLLLFTNLGIAQTIPANRTCNWENAGVKDTTTLGFQNIFLDDLGANSSGNAPNDGILQSIFDTLSTGAFIRFGNGTYLFNQQIEIPNNVVFKGNGADSTQLLFDLWGSGDAIKVQGSIDNSSSTGLVQNASTGGQQIRVSNGQHFQANDWVIITVSDSDLVTSSWAERSVGQIAQIASISQNTLTLESELRLDLDVDRFPRVTKLNPANNVGFECLAVERLDDTDPSQSSTFFFQRAVNCWLNGVESRFCTFSHVDVRNSSSLSIVNSFFHEGFSYGSGGRAYGVMLHFTSNEVLVENNVFETLRHAMILQAGANGNVFAYNYSRDATRVEPPSDFSGDLVLHGNYPFLNLFEQNICQNIAIDNSHDANGPYNTFFRNRAEKWGIFFSDSSSPSQNLVGNEISNDQIPYNILNYSIEGSNHFVYGNNNKGTVDPAGTDNLSDLSYFYSSPPSFLSAEQFAGIGYPNGLDENSIPAKTAFETGNLSAQLCENSNDSSSNSIAYGFTQTQIRVFPNPVSDIVTISSPHEIVSVQFIDINGKVLIQEFHNTNTARINTQSLENGVYYLKIQLQQNAEIHKLIKLSH